MSESDIRVVAEIDSAPAVAGAQQFTVALGTMRAGVEGAAASLTRMEGTQAATASGLGAVGQGAAQVTASLGTMSAGASTATASVARLGSAIGAVPAGAQAATASLVALESVLGAMPAGAAGAAQVTAGLGTVGLGAKTATGSVAGLDAAIGTLPAGAAGAAKVTDSLGAAGLAARGTTSAVIGLESVLELMPSAALGVDKVTASLGAMGAGARAAAASTAGMGAAAAGVAAVTTEFATLEQRQAVAAGGLGRMAAGLNTVAPAAQAVATGAAQATASVERLGQGAKEAEKSVGSLGGALGIFAGFLAAEVIGKGIADVIKLSDTYATQVGRLKVLTGDTQSAIEVYNKLAAAADRARTPIDTLADSYYKNNRALKEMGVGVNDAVALNETLAKVITLSGTTTQAAAAGMYELNQAFMVGRLNGREFRAIAQDLPLVLRLLEEQTGKTAGELRKMASEGQITAQTLYTALHNATDGVNKDFQALPQTAGNAMVVFGADFGRIMGRVANDAGVTRAVAKDFNTLRDALNDPQMQAGMTNIAFGVLKIAEALGVASAAMIRFIGDYSRIAREQRTIDAIREKDGWQAAANAVNDGSAYRADLQARYLGPTWGASRPPTTAGAGNVAQGSWATETDAPSGKLPVTFGNGNSEQAQKAAERLVATTREHLIQLTMVNELSRARLNGDTLVVTALENQLAIQKAISPELMKASPGLAARLEQQVLIEQSLKRQQVQQDELRRAGEQFGSTIADTFMNAAKQGLSFETAIRQVVAKLIEMAAQLYIIKPLIASMGDGFAGTSGGKSGSSPITSLITSLITGALTGGAAPGAGGWGATVQFADGGVVDGATAFKAGSVRGVMGEAGPEAIMPLSRASNGQLGVTVTGAGGNSGNGNNGAPVSVYISIAGDATDNTLAKMQGVARQVAEAVVATRSKGIIGASVQATRNEIVRDPGFMRRA